MHCLKAFVKTLQQSQCTVSRCSLRLRTLKAFIWDNAVVISYCLKAFIKTLQQSLCIVSRHSLKHCSSHFALSQGNHYDTAAVTLHCPKAFIWDTTAVTLHCMKAFIKTLQQSHCTVLRYLLKDYSSHTVLSQGIH